MKYVNMDKLTKKKRNYEQKPYWYIKIKLAYDYLFYVQLRNTFKCKCR